MDSATYTVAPGTAVYDQKKTNFKLNYKEAMVVGVEVEIKYRATAGATSLTTKTHSFYYNNSTYYSEVQTYPASPNVNHMYLVGAGVLKGQIKSSDAPLEIPNSKTTSGLSEALITLDEMCTIANVKSADSAYPSSIKLENIDADYTITFVMGFRTVLNNEANDSHASARANDGTKKDVYTFYKGTTYTQDIPLSGTQLIEFQNDPSFKYNTAAHTNHLIRGIVTSVIFGNDVIYNKEFATTVENDGEYTNTLKSIDGTKTTFDYTKLTPINSSDLDDKTNLVVYVITRDAYLESVIKYDYQTYTGAVSTAAAVENTISVDSWNSSGNKLAKDSNYDTSKDNTNKFTGSNTTDLTFYIQYNTTPYAIAKTNPSSKYRPVLVNKTEIDNGVRIKTDLLDDIGSLSDSASVTITNQQTYFLYTVQTLKVGLQAQLGGTYATSHFETGDITLKVVGAYNDPTDGLLVPFDSSKSRPDTGDTAINQGLIGYTYTTTKYDYSSRLVFEYYTADTAKYSAVGASANAADDIGNRQYVVKVSNAAADTAVASGYGDTPTIFNDGDAVYYSNFRFDVNTQLVYVAVPSIYNGTLPRPMMNVYYNKPTYTPGTGSTNPSTNVTTVIGGDVTGRDLLSYSGITEGSTGSNPYSKTTVNYTQTFTKRTRTVSGTSFTDYEVNSIIIKDANSADLKNYSATAGLLASRLVVATAYTTSDYSKPELIDDFGFTYHVAYGEQIFVTRSDLEAGTADNKITSMSVFKPLGDTLNEGINESKIATLPDPESNASDYANVTLLTELLTNTEGKKAYAIRSADLENRVYGGLVNSHGLWEHYVIMLNYTPIVSFETHIDKDNSDLVSLGLKYNQLVLDDLVNTKVNGKRFYSEKATGNTATTDISVGYEMHQPYTVSMKIPDGMEVGNSNDFIVRINSRKFKEGTTNVSLSNGQTQAVTVVVGNNGVISVTFYIDIYNVDVNTGYGSASNGFYLGFIVSEKYMSFDSYKLNINGVDVPDKTAPLIGSDLSKVYEVTWYEFNYINATVSTEGDDDSLDYNEINSSDLHGDKYVEIDTVLTVSGTSDEYYSKMGTGNGNDKFIVGYYAQIKYTFQLFDTENYAIGKPSGSGGGVLLASSTVSNGYTAENHNIDSVSGRSSLMYSTPTAENLKGNDCPTELITLFSPTTTLPAAGVMTAANAGTSNKIFTTFYLVRKYNVTFERELYYVTTKMMSVGNGYSIERILSEFEIANNTDAGTQSGKNSVTDPDTKLVLYYGEKLYVNYTLQTTSPFKTRQVVFINDEDSKVLQQNTAVSDNSRVSLSYEIASNIKVIAEFIEKQYKVNYITNVSGLKNVNFVLETGTATTAEMTNTINNVVSLNGKTLSDYEAQRSAYEDIVTAYQATGYVCTQNYVNNTATAALSGVGVFTNIVVGAFAQVNTYLTYSTATKAATPTNGTNIYKFKFYKVDPIAEDRAEESGVELYITDTDTSASGFNHTLNLRTANFSADTLAQINKDVSILASFITLHSINYGKIYRNMYTSDGLFKVANSDEIYATTMNNYNYVNINRDGLVERTVNIEGVPYYENGTKLRVDITIDEGYEFNKWTDAISYANSVSTQRSSEIILGVTPNCTHTDIVLEATISEVKKEVSIPTIYKSLGGVTEGEVSIDSTTLHTSANSDYDEGRGTTVVTKALALSITPFANKTLLELHKVDYSKYIMGYYTNYTITVTPKPDFRIGNISGFEETVVELITNSTNRSTIVEYPSNDNASHNPVTLNLGYRKSNVTDSEYTGTHYDNYSVIIHWVGTKTIKIRTARLYNVDQGSKLKNTVELDPSAGVLRFVTSTGDIRVDQSDSITAVFDTDSTNNQIIITENEFMASGYRYRFLGIYSDLDHTKKVADVGANDMYTKSGGYIVFNGVYTYELPQITADMDTDIYAVFVMQYAVNLNAVYYDQTNTVSGGDFSNPLNSMEFEVSLKEINSYTYRPSMTAGLNENSEEIKNGYGVSGKTILTPTQTNNEKTVALPSTSLFYDEGAQLKFNISNTATLSFTNADGVTINNSSLKWLYPVSVEDSIGTKLAVLKSQAGNLDTSVTENKLLDIICANTNAYNVYFEYFFRINLAYINKVTGEVLTRSADEFTVSCTSIPANDEPKYVHSINTNPDGTTTETYNATVAPTRLYRSGAQVSITATPEDGVFKFVDWIKALSSDSAESKVNASALSTNNPYSFTIGDSTMFKEVNNKDKGYIYYARVLQYVLVRLMVHDDYKIFVADHNLRYIDPDTGNLVTSTLVDGAHLISVPEGTVVDIFAKPYPETFITGIVYTGFTEGEKTVATYNYPSRVPNIPSMYESTYDVVTTGTDYLIRFAAVVNSSPKTAALKETTGTDIATYVISATSLTKVDVDIPDPLNSNPGGLSVEFITLFENGFDKTVLYSNTGLKLFYNGTEFFVRGNTGLGAFVTTRTDIMFDEDGKPWFITGSEINLEFTISAGFDGTALVDGSGKPKEGTTTITKVDNYEILRFVILLDNPGTAMVKTFIKEKYYSYTRYFAMNGINISTVNEIYQVNNIASDCKYDTFAPGTNTVVTSSSTIGYFGTITFEEDHSRDQYARFNGWYLVRDVIDLEPGEEDPYSFDSKTIEDVINDGKAINLNVSDRTIEITGTPLFDGTNALSNYIERNFIILADFKAVYTVNVEAYYRYAASAPTPELRGVGADDTTATVGTTFKMETGGLVNLNSDGTNHELRVDITNVQTKTLDGTYYYDIGTEMIIQSKVNNNEERLWGWYFISLEKLNNADNSDDKTSTLIGLYDYNGGNPIYDTGSLTDHRITLAGDVATLKFNLSLSTAGTYYAIYKKYYSVTIASADNTLSQSGGGDYGIVTSTLTTGHIGTDINSYSVLGTHNTNANPDEISKWVEYSSKLAFEQETVDVANRANYSFEYWDVATLDESGNILDVAKNTNSDVPELIIDSNFRITAYFIQRFKISFSTNPSGAGSFGLFTPSEDGYREGDVVEVTCTNNNTDMYRFSRITKKVGEEFVTVVSGGDITIIPGTMTINIVINQNTAGEYVYQFITMYSISVTTSPNGIPTYFGMYQAKDSDIAGSQELRWGISTGYDIEEENANVATSKFRIARTVESGADVNILNKNDNQIILRAEHPLDYRFQGFAFSNLAYIHSFEYDDEDLIEGNGTPYGELIVVNANFSVIYYDAIFDSEGELVQKAYSLLYINSAYMTQNVTIRLVYTGEYHLYNIAGYGYVTNENAETGAPGETVTLKYYQPTNEVLKGNAEQTFKSYLIPGYNSIFNGVSIVYEIFKEGEEEKPKKSEFTREQVEAGVVDFRIETNNIKPGTELNPEYEAILVNMNMLPDGSVLLTISSTEYILVVTAYFEMQTWINDVEAPTAGDGTINNPYLISTAEQLAWISNIHTIVKTTEEILPTEDPEGEDVIIHSYEKPEAAYYLQTADIDLSGKWWIPIGVISPFEGVYNGNGYRIYNASVLTHDGLKYSDITFGVEIPESDTYEQIRYINKAAGSTENYSIEATELLNFVGLFGQTNYATILNIDLSSGTDSLYTNDRIRELTANSTFMSKDYTTTQYVGSIAGLAMNTIVDNVKFEGKIDAYYLVRGTQNVYVGGIIGYAADSTIKNAATIRQANSNTYSGVFDPQGSYSGYVRDNYNGVILLEMEDGLAVDKAAYVGGLVGYLSNSSLETSTSKGIIDNIINSYDTAFVVNTGGLVGAINGESNVSDSYASIGVSLNKPSNPDVEVYFGGIVGDVVTAETILTNVYFDASLGFTFNQANAVGAIVGKFIGFNIQDAYAKNLVYTNTYGSKLVNKFELPEDRTEGYDFESYGLNNYWMTTINNSLANKLSLKIADARGTWVDAIPLDFTIANLEKSTALDGTVTYYVTNGYELQWAIMNITNATIRLKNDIDLGGKYFISSTLASDTTLYGCGYTVYNLTLVNIYNNPSMHEGELNNALINENHGYIWHFNIDQSISYNNVVDVNKNTDYAMMVATNYGYVNKVIVNGLLIVNDHNSNAELNVGGVVGKSYTAETVDNKPVHKVVNKGDILFNAVYFEMAAGIYANIGGLVGTLTANSGLSNSYLAGSIAISENDAASYVGGLVGRSFGGDITNCYVDQNAIIENSPNNLTGFIIGNAVSDVKIEDSYTMANVIPNDPFYCRGFVGVGTATVVDSFILNIFVEEEDDGKGDPIEPTPEGYPYMEMDFFQDEHNFSEKRRQKTITDQLNAGEEVTFVPHENAVSWDFDSVWYFDGVPKLLDTNNSHHIEIATNLATFGAERADATATAIGLSIPSENANSFILLVPHGETGYVSLWYNYLTTSNIVKINYKNTGDNHEVDMSRTLENSAPDLDGVVSGGEYLVYREYTPNVQVYAPDVVTFNFTLNVYTYKVIIEESLENGYGYIGDPPSTASETTIVHGDWVIIRAIERADNGYYTRFQSLSYGDNSSDENIVTLDKPHYTRTENAFTIENWESTLVASSEEIDPADPDDPGAEGETKEYVEITETYPIVKMKAETNSFATDYYYTQYNTMNNGVEVTVTEIRFKASSYNDCDIATGLTYRIDFIRTYDAIATFKLAPNDEGLTDSDVAGEPGGSWNEEEFGLKTQWRLISGVTNSKYKGRFNDGTKVALEVYLMYGYELLEVNHKTKNLSEYGEIYELKVEGYMISLSFDINEVTEGGYEFYINRIKYLIELMSFKGALVSIDAPEGQQGGVYYVIETQLGEDNVTREYVEPKDMSSKEVLVNNLATALNSPKKYAATYGNSVEVTFNVDYRYNFVSIFAFVPPEGEEKEEYIELPITTEVVGGEVYVTAILENVTRNCNLIAYISQKKWTDVDYFEGMAASRYSFISSTMEATSSNNGLSYETAFIIDSPEKFARLAYLINNDISYTFEGVTYRFENACYKIRYFESEFNFASRFWDPIKTFSGVIVFENVTQFANLTIDTSELHEGNQIKDDDGNELFDGLIKIQNSGIFENLVGATIYGMNLINTNFVSSALNNGIISAFASASTIANIQIDNTNSISATSMGGIVGEINSGTIIYESYSNANIEAMNYIEKEYDVIVGGLVGQSNNGSILNSYTQSSITINTISKDEDGIQNVDFIAGVVALANGHTSVSNVVSDVILTANVGQAIEMISVSKESNTMISNVYYMRGESYTGGVRLDAASAAQGMYSGFDFKNVWVYNNGTIPTLLNTKTTWESTITGITTEFTTDFEDDKGTEENPYLIKNASDLAMLARVIAEDDSTYNNPNVYFEIPASVDYIDLGNNEFTPIGMKITRNGLSTSVSVVDFKANFYGNYAVIKNLYINKPYLNNVGLFAKVTGSVNNIVVNSNMVAGRENTSIAIAYITGSEIEGYKTQAFGVETSGRVIGNTNVGGSIGYAGPNVYIKNLSNDYAKNTDSYVSTKASVYGYKNVGGVVGQAQSAIYSVYNHLAYVYGGDNTGGVVGYSTATVKDAYNNGGSVITDHYYEYNYGLDTLTEREFNNVGGIAGFGTTVVNIYVTADVYSGARYCGEIVGYGNSILIKDSFYANRVVKTNPDATFVNGAGTTATSNAEYKSISALQSANGMTLLTTVGWDFLNTWSFKSGENDNLAVLRYFYGTVVFVRVNKDTPYGQITPNPIFEENEEGELVKKDAIRAEDGDVEVYIMMGEPQEFTIEADRTENGYEKDYHISDISLDGVSYVERPYDNDFYYINNYTVTALSSIRERKTLVVSFSVDTFKITFNYVKVDKIVDNSIAVDGPESMVPTGPDGVVFDYGTVIKLELQTIHNLETKVGFRFDKFIHNTNNISNQTSSIDDEYVFEHEEGSTIYGITFTVLPSTAGDYFAMLVRQFYVDVDVVGDSRHAETIMGKVFHTENDLTNAEIPQFAMGDEFVDGWYDVGTKIELRADPIIEEGLTVSRFEFVGWIELLDGNEVFRTDTNTHTLTPIPGGLAVELTYYAVFRIRTFNVTVTMNEDGYMTYSYNDIWSEDTKTDVVVPGAVTEYFVVEQGAYGTEVYVQFDAYVEHPMHYIHVIEVYNTETGSLITDIFMDEGYSSNDYTKKFTIPSLEHSIHFNVVFDPDLWTRGHYEAIPNSQINGNTVIIKTNAELAYVAYMARTNAVYTTGKTFVVDNALDMKQYFWEPIGVNNVINFVEFNGANYDISNVYIKRYLGSTYYGSDYENNYIGLFGIVNGNVNNVRLTALNYTGEYVNSAVGSIVGKLVGGTVFECYADGAINTLATNIGGIVGTNESIVKNNNNATTIEMLTIPEGSIISSIDNVGGIVGANYGSVLYNKNAGNINVVGNNVGGIIGVNYNVAEQNVNSGFVTGYGNVGGIAGLLSFASITSKAIKDSYNLGDITATMGAAGGIVGNITRVDGTVAVYTSYNVGPVAGVNQGAIYGINNVLAQIKNCYTNVGNISGQATELSEDALKLENSFVGFNFNFPWTIRPELNNGMPVLILAETRGYHVATEIPADQIDGNTYHIKTAGELAYVANMVNTTVGFATNKVFVLDNDIDLFGHYFDPIGKTASNTFSGEFDGNNMNISYITIIQNSNSLGLFGYASTNSIIKDFNVNNAYVEQLNDSQSYATGIVVGTTDGLISNIKTLRGYITDNNIDTATYVNKSMGGIAGVINGQGVLLQNKAQIISSNANVGGVVGKLTGTLQQSSSHDIGNDVLDVYTITTSIGNVGGVVGYADTGFVIEDVYNRASISIRSSSASVGGVVGYAIGGEISNTYGVQEVSGIGRYGSIIGTSNGNTLTRNYYLSSDIGIATALDGLADEEGKLESLSLFDMKVPSSYVDWDFGTIWAIVKHVDQPMYNEGYPVLIQMYDYSVVKIEVTNMEQTANVEERHGVVTTEYGYVLGDRLLVIDGEDTLIFAIPDEDSYIESIDILEKDDPEIKWNISYDRYQGNVSFEELTKDVTVVIEFSKYVFDLFITGAITASEGYVVDPSVKVVVFVQNLTTRKTYSIVLNHGQEGIIYAVELGSYQLRVATPMFHETTITFGEDVITGQFELTKTSHAEQRGAVTIGVTINKYAEQWINDSSPTW